MLHNDGGVAIKCFHLAALPIQFVFLFIRTVVQFPWPDFDKPTFFWDVKGQEECSISSHSFSNMWAYISFYFNQCTVLPCSCSDEAVCTLTVLRMLLENRVEKSQIGIITPYTDQKGVIKSYLTQGTNIEVNLCVVSVQNQGFVSFWSE